MTPLRALSLLAPFAVFYEIPDFPSGADVDWRKHRHGALLFGIPYFARSRMPGSMQAKLVQHTIRSINKIGLLVYSNLKVAAQFFSTLGTRQELSQGKTNANEEPSLSTQL